MTIIVVVLLVVVILVVTMGISNFIMITNQKYY